MPTLEDAYFKTADWSAVQFLTRQVDQTKPLAGAIAQWDLTVRLFRAVEQRRLYEKEPTQNDLANHRALLHLLIGLGQQWELAASDFSDEQLGIKRADLRAYIEDLEDTFFLWHVPDFEPARSAELAQRIFGAHP